MKKHITTDDGINLYVEETGSGTPIIFVHEFAGCYKSWEPQVRHFARSFRCITFNARGYPPSDVPDDVSKYSQDRAVDDIKNVMDALNLRQAHIVGLSMGGFAALHFAIKYPANCISACVAGVGYGAEPEKKAIFEHESTNSANFLLEHGMAAFAKKYTSGPTRQPYFNADPRGFAEFQNLMASFNNRGCANTQLGVQRNRPSLYELQDQFKDIRTPILIINGDEDWPCLKPGIMLKENIASAALVVLPNCGHTINLEYPDIFNRLLDDFFARVASQRWPSHNPQHAKGSITGMSN